MADRRRAWRRAILLSCLAPATACSTLPPVGEQYDDYRARRGTLVAHEETLVGYRGRYERYVVRLESSTGMVATGQMLRPRTRDDRAWHPAVLLNAGREQSSGAVHSLPPDFGDVIVLSLDYPEELPHEVSVWTLLRHRGRLRDASRDVAAIFSLAAGYLIQLEGTDPERLGIVGTSFAVPFAVIAAAMDPRYRNVGLIYGAGDMPLVLAANLEIRPDVLRRWIARVALRPFREFEPVRHVPAIAPRPIVMVNGIDDPQMPVLAVQRLFDAAREPKELIWKRTGHILPGDTTLIHALVDTAFARIPILRGAKPF